VHHDLEPKDALLLAYLAIEGPTSRGRIAALLWPDVEDDRARGNLRQRLLRLKRTTGVELVTGNPQARLAGGVGHDLEGTHELLAGIGLEQAGGLAEWLEAQRERRRRVRSAALAAAVGQAQAEGDLALALEHANGLVELDPWSEEAHRQLMRLHYLRGDVGAAMAAFERCARLLRAELGAEPSKETLQLRSQIEKLPVEPAGTTQQTVPVTILRPPRLIGRDAEWAALHAAWAAGDPASVLGEAGMGKTRLVTDFARFRGRVAVVCARPGDERVVYALAARLLRHLPPDAVAGLDVAVRAELARLLPEFGDAQPLRSDAERARFCNAVGSVLERPAVGLAGVVVDDLHFADEASVELLHYLCGDSRLRWIFAGRPAELGAAARSLVDALTLRSPEAVMQLAPLTQLQLAEFVASLGITGLSGNEHAAALMRHTGGNPLFVLETIKAWMSQRADESAVRLPTVGNVRALISRRIGRLSPEAVRLARCAAIAGQDFSADVAAHVLGVRPLDLVDAWSELEAAQIFRDGSFVHDIIGEAALASVPTPIARQLHREIAQYLGERNGEPARIAGHWLASEQWGPAGAALMEAASRSGAARRWREAAAQLDEAARCFERTDDRSGRFEALLRRSEVLVYCDLGDESVACARAARDAAVTDDERVRGATVLMGLLAHRGDAAEVVAMGPGALELACGMGDRDSELRLAVRVSGSLCNLQRIPEALAILEPLRTWVDTQAEPAERAEYYMALGFALDLGSLLSDAVRALELSCQAARDAGLDVVLAEAMSNLATANAKLGRVRRAAELGRQAIELMRGDDGIAGRSLQSQVMLAHRLRDLGNYAEAVPLFEESLAHFRAAGSRFWVAGTAHRLALAWMQLGQFARAQRLLSEDPGDPAPRSQAMWAVCRAELARLHGGRTNEARKQVRLALQLLEHWPDDGAYRIATLFATAILPAEEGEPLATDLAAWANARERLGTAMAAHVRAAAGALEQQAIRRALPHVEAALRLAPDFDMDSMYRGELWLVAYRTYVAVGDDTLARRMLGDGLSWVTTLAELHVPPAYRDSFLHRNPVNRELLRLATILK
jgi:DNA-binding SARP family transcriptional activator/tetratricopeptide (TPR) repeat protein